MSERGDWTLPAWKEHVERMREADRQLGEAHRDRLELRIQIVEERLAADREMSDRRFAHVLELAERQQATNDIYFAQLSKTVTLERFDPFEAAMKEFVAKSQGQRLGTSTTMNWVIAVAGAVVGAVGALLANGVL